MQFYTLEPLLDSRWDDLVASHPRASVFHHTGWLGALAKTYGYRVLAFSSSPPGEPLRDGLVFCEIKSWITGSRLVSLPFSDHTNPLVSEDVSGFALQDWLQMALSAHQWRYIELRPLSWRAASINPLAPSQTFWAHTLSLAPSFEQLFRSLHKSCIQRRIRHAEREHLYYERSHSQESLDDFYRLLIITRRRHGLLPQPRAWFSNLVAGMGQDVEIRTVRKNGLPVAAILTLRHRNTVVYKYGCSDERFHHLGAMPFLFWKLIEESKSNGAEEIDFGRTSLDNKGLIEFKDHLGTNRVPLIYQRYSLDPGEIRVQRIIPFGVRTLFSVLPDVLSSRFGGIVYRHLG
jgi:CelD/BcsL family acetyltransferase involved in cellulose biosynthesis